MKKPPEGGFFLIQRLEKPKVCEICKAVACNLGSQASSSRSAGAEIDSPAINLA
jgi:hypothetical protein